MRRLGFVIVGAALATGTFTSPVIAATAWLASSELTPVEQRIAVALGPERTTVWTSMRFVAPPGPVGFVVPVPSGASVDRSSDAWFEALELATAVRVFPPMNASPACPAVEVDPDAHPFDLGTGLEHVPSLPPAEVTVLDGAGGVAAWASSCGLELSGELAAALGATGAPRFVGVRLTSPGGQSLGPTLRVVVASSQAVLPLALLRSGAEELRVTAFVVGEGRAALADTTAAAVRDEDLAWLANEGRSNYATLRTESLDAVGPASSLIEASSHEALAASIPIDDGRASIDGAVITYFERAVGYGDTEGDATTCIATAASALAATWLVAAGCPEGALASEQDGAPCTETDTPNVVSPSALRCGKGADDLALALAGASPASTWLTRYELRVPPNARGVDVAVELTDEGALVPTRVAEKVDASGCPAAGSAGGDGSEHPGGDDGKAPNGGAAAPDQPSSGGVAPGGPNDDELPTDPSPSASVTIDASCGGDSSSSSSNDGSDGCGSSDGTADPSSSDSCDGASSSDSSSGDSCDGASSSDSSSGDSCDSGSSSGSEDCAIPRGRGAKGRHRPLRASPIAMAMFAMLALLRRARRPARRSAGRAAP